MADYNIKSYYKRLRKQFVSGEIWLGLEKLHQLTSEADYGLRITLKDFDQQTYMAYYDQFQVMLISDHIDIDYDGNDYQYDDYDSHHPVMFSCTGFCTISVCDDNQGDQLG